MSIHAERCIVAPPTTTSMLDGAWRAAESRCMEQAPPKLNSELARGVSSHVKLKLIFWFSLFFMFLKG